MLIAVEQQESGCQLQKPRQFPVGIAFGQNGCLRNWKLG